MRSAVLLALACAACGDDLSLAVEVAHPVAVTRTVISVHESEAVTCAQVEFGDLDAAQLDATLVAEQVLDGTGKVTSGDLDGLSRTQTKTIVARGYDAAGTLLAAGCAEKGVIEGKDKVHITTVLAATVSVVSDSADPYALRVLATKPDGTLLDKRAVSWRVYGPVGTTAYHQSADAVDLGNSEWQPAVQACTNSSGVAKIHPIPPSLIGGFATRVRVSWAAQQVPQQSALTKIDITPTVISAQGLAHPCAIKVSGATRHLVCLDRAGATTARAYSVTVDRGVASLTAPTTTTLSAGPWLGVVAVPTAAGGADREVYAMDTSGNLTALFGAAAPTSTVCPACAGAVADFLVAPACGDLDPEARLYLRVGVNRLRAMKAHGGVALEILGFAPLTENFDELELTGAGCITQVTPAGSKVSRQLGVVTLSKLTSGIVTSSTNRGFYNCTAGGCAKLLLPVGDSGVTFAAVGAENRLYGTSVDATGVSISSWVMLPDPDPLQPDRLLERDRVPSAALPHRLVSGQLDDDGELDLLWDQGGRRGALELAYGRLAGAQRLEAMSTVPLPALTDLLIDDLTGDGHPELVLVGAPGTVGNVGLVVIPTHVEPPQTTVVAESCP